MKECISFNNFHAIGNVNMVKATAIRKNCLSDSFKLLRDSNTIQLGTVLVFANDFISITCVLNGRKVTVKILKRLEIDEDLTFLTFLNAICNYFEIFATQLFDS